MTHYSTGVNALLVAIGLLCLMWVYTIIRYIVVVIRSYPEKSTSRGKGRDCD